MALAVQLKKEGVEDWEGWQRASSTSFRGAIVDICRRLTSWSSREGTEGIDWVGGKDFSFPPYSKIHLDVRYIAAGKARFVIKIIFLHIVGSPYEKEMLAICNGKQSVAI